MSRLDNNVKIIGRLKGHRSGRWEFQPSVQGERVLLQIQHCEQPLGVSIQFKNRIEFSDWFESCASDEGIEKQDMVVDDIIRVMRE